MATDPIGGGPQEFDIPATGPANYGGPANFNAMQDSVNAMASSNVELNRTMAELVHTMAMAFDKLQKGSKDVYDNVKDTVNVAGRLEDAIEHTGRLQKDLNRMLSSEKSTYKEIQDQAEKVLTHLNKQLRITKDSIQQQTLLKSSIKAVSTVFEDASRNAKKFGTGFTAATNSLKEYQREADKATRNNNALFSSFGRFEASRFEKHLQGINRAYRDAGMQVKVLERLEDSLGRHRALQQVKAAVIQHRQTAGGGTLDYTPKGRIDWSKMGKRPRDEAAIKAAQGMDYSVLARQTAFGGGRSVLGSVDAALSARAMRARDIAAAGGPQPGMVGKMAVGAVEAGGGSVLGGAAAGGIGAMAAMAGPAGAIIAAATVVKDLIDKIAITNQAIEKGMGGALFTPGVSGGTALNTVRQNLSANAVNAYGQNLERNLAIAQAMQEQGLDITELSAPGSIRNRRMAGGGQPKVGEGFLGGAFGEFQRNAMTAGRGAGLTDVQTVVRMTKMLQEMRQTFEATHDFLESVNVQARAAGISTTKYLSIIDDLTGQFDRLNKSFNETVSIVQALGASGTDTADKLVAMAKALTGAGETKTLEQKAFAFTQMTPEMRSALQNTQRTIVANSVQKLNLALNDAGVDTSGMDLSTPHGLLMVQNTIANMPEGPQKQALQSAADDARYQMNQQAIIAAGTAGGGRGAVGAAYGTLAYGEGAAVKAGQQITLLQKALALGGQTFEDLVKNPEQVSLRAAASAATLGIDPKDFQSAVEAIVALGAGQVQQVRAMTTGGPGSDRERQLRHFYEVGKRYGVGGLGNKFNETGMLNALNNSKIASGISEGLETDMANDPKQMLDILTQAHIKGNADAQDRQTKDVAMETRTTSDYMANAFEYLFRQVVDVLMDIKYILDGWSLKSFGQLFGDAGPSKETSEMIDIMRAKGMFVESNKALREASAGGNVQATHQLAALQAYDNMRPDERTEAQAQEVASILRANSIAAYNPAGMSDTDWTNLLKQPDVSKQALDEQAIREISAQGPGGEFGAAGDKFWLGQNLQGKQLDAMNAMLREAGLGKVETNLGGHQYINITMNSTDIAAFMNRYGQEMHNVKSNSEVAVGKDGGAYAAKPKAITFVGSGGGPIPPPR